MKFWLLTSEYPPVSGGGISTYCYETVCMLEAKGHRVTVFTQDFSISETTEGVQGSSRIVRFNPEKCSTASFLGYEANLSFSFSEVVRCYMEKEGVPDVIEAQEYMGIAYYLLQFKRLNYSLFNSTKVLITLHSPSFLYLEYNQVVYHRMPYYWIGEMEKFCIVSADMLISPSRFLVEEIGKRMDISGKKVHIVKNPYQVDPPATFKDVVRNKIVFFGKLTPQKGCLKLIEYFRQIWDRGGSHPLIMIGAGNHLYHSEGIDMDDFIRRKYKGYIQRRLLRLLGAIKPAELNTHFADAHVILVPSLVDNLPYAVLEAMGRGKIVLSSVQGGQSEIITNGRDGFLFDHRNEISFQEQLQHILGLSKESIEEVGSHAIQTIQKEYSYEVIYELKSRLLKQLMKTEVKESFPFVRPIKTTQPIDQCSSEPNALISIVVPYYNMGKYVDDAITSIYKADHKNVEIIIVNDGSDDAQSIEKLAELEEKYNVKVVHQSNQGLSIARNTGAHKAKGDYLAFLDPDDTIEPSYYTKALDVLQRNVNVYFVGCWAKYFGASKSYWPSFNPEPPYLLFHNMINSSALVYKKEAFLRAGLNDKVMVFGMEDYESVIGMTKAGYQGVALPEALWNYRIRKNSMARAFTTDKQLYLYRLISEKHNEFYAGYASELSNLLNANGPGIRIDNPTLIYDLPGTNLLGHKLRQKLIAKIKSKPGLRKVAIMIKKKLI
jgi:glycosyltransferase involved in cell wall biosynthesis